ncbi:sodium/potassium-transporting ATPase subunit beta-1-interacting protein isoform X1 [Calliphora vicina]|uniref:sodium/potassium-transporting ATPase subunit beta-1-interacting protein isoform X1 n=2 Tax=Calliphora vicina TaxID=7373 RepID=UPI00325B154C
MGSCTRRHFLLSTCFLQMITIIERQVFDFLGYMWAPIFVNFFHILFIIFGFYGAYHFRIKYIITYLIWNFLWIGWNSFLICFYLNVGTLDRDSDLLNLGTGSVSWFEVNGYGCKPIYNTNITSEDPYRPIRPETVDDCLLTYDIVEVVHSGVQCLLAFFGILGAILISYIFLDEDDRFDFMNGDAKSPQHTVVHPMYVSYTSIPTSASATMLSNKHQNQNQNHTHHTLSNSNNHLSNSNHAICTNTTTSTTTPTATKKKFSSSQQTSLHKQILTSATTATTNNNSNHQQHSNSISHNNSNRYSNNSNNSNANNSNSNTFLIHTHHNHHHNQQQQQQHSNSQSRNRGAVIGEGSFNGSLVSNSSQFEPFNTGSSHHHRRRHRNMSPTSRSFTPNPSNASNSLTHMLYSPKQCRKVQPTSTNSIFPANIDLAQKQPIMPAYYDDSTAKADHQLYVNGSRRQMLLTQSPTQDTTPSLSYASLQNSTQNLNSSLKQNATTSLGSGGNALNSSLSNSNYSLTNSLNNNQSQHLSSQAAIHSGAGEGHFARIHSKPKPAKSSSYSSFKHASSAANAVAAASACSAAQRPDIKYSEIFNETTSNQFDESFEEDNFSIQNLKADEGVTYVPFTKPTPGNYFLTPSAQLLENNNSPHSLNSRHSQNSLNNNSNHQQLRTSPNNNSSQITPHNYHDNSGILLEHGAILQPLTPHDLNPAQRALYQQNGLPFHPAYSPTPYRQNSACPAQKQTPRPTNIPLPKVPASYNAEFLSPSEVTPPPPPQPRPHIFQPRTGTAPYPDLSPEVTERYAMPTQYIPRSPVASRIARRQRQQNSHNERSHAPLNSSANFCDQIRDTPPGYAADNGSIHTYTISKARSHDRLSSSRNTNGSLRDKERAVVNERSNTKESQHDQEQELAPHVNRRSGRRDGVKIRPRSYCNSMSGGEGVIRNNISNDRKLGYAA